MGLFCFFSGTITVFAKFLFTKRVDALEDRNKARRWLQKADKQNSLLSEAEMGNLRRYLDICTDINSDVSKDVSTAAVPKHIDVMINDVNGNDLSTIGMASANDHSNNSYVSTYDSQKHSVDVSFQETNHQRGTERDD